MHVNVLCARLQIQFNFAGKSKYLYRYFYQYIFSLFLSRSLLSVFYCFFGVAGAYEYWYLMNTWTQRATSRTYNWCHFLHTYTPIIFFFILFCFSHFFSGRRENINFSRHFSVNANQIENSKKEIRRKKERAVWLIVLVCSPDPKLSTFYGSMCSMIITNKKHKKHSTLLEILDSRNS